MWSCNCCNWIWKDKRIFLRCDPVTIVTGFVKKKRFYLSICIFCNWFWEKKYNFFTLEIVKQLMWWNDIRFFLMEFWPSIFLAEKSCSNFFYLEKLVRDFFMGFRDYEHEGVALDPWEKVVTILFLFWKHFVKDIGEIFRHLFNMQVASY